MSLLLVRLMQNFSSISLELDAYPPGTLPPEEFKLASGRKAIDKVWPKSNLTLYLAVRCSSIILFICPSAVTHTYILGRALG
jgi:hypothetical protein